MHVSVIAQSELRDFDAMEDAGYSFHGYEPEDRFAEDADELAEFAGRNCYQAWERKRPETATNKGYLNNIIGMGHESVLEHASVSFFVSGVSRSMTHELIRHRHLSFSELSQRYVNMDKTEFIIPPAIYKTLDATKPEGTTDQGIREFWNDNPHWEDVRTAYSEIAEQMSDAGELTRKEVREAARVVMPNGTETKLVVSGNLRAWRDVLKKRYAASADAEIREFAIQVLGHLRSIAPNSFQDFPDKPFGTENG